MKLFAIEHKPTGRVMPETSRGRGYTMLDLEKFIPLDRPCGQVPRLLTTAKGAELALRAWLKGAWEREYERSDYDGANFVVGATPPAVAPPDRKREEMGVIAMTLARARR